MTDRVPASEGDEPEIDELGRPLPSDFFERDKFKIARDLLGHDLVRRVGGDLRAGRIVETEAYGGPDDPASHADSGEPTKRTASMFGPPGSAYVYSIHAYFCLNIVAPAAQKAAAVLIRAVVPRRGLRGMLAGRGRFESGEDDPWDESVVGELASGPGKLCEAFAIDRQLDGLQLPADELWIAEGPEVADEHVERTPRIGLNPDTVGEAVDWPWRWVVADSPYLSR